MAAVEVTVHVRVDGGKCTCLASISVPRCSPGGDIVVVTFPVVVAETTYSHLPAYDDSFRTDNSSSCCGKFLIYVAHGEITVSPVGDGSSNSVPEITSCLENW